MPFTGVTAELPGLLSYVGGLLQLTPAQVVAVLPVSFPHLAQSVANLPLVTGGWDNVSGVSGLKSFTGTPVRTVVQVRDYFSGDVIPVLQTEQGDFATLTSITPPISWFPTLLTIVGVLVIVYALAMIVLARKVEPRARRPERSVAPT